jgi:hypothetical protein
MARYHFDISDDTDSRDDEGQELNSREEAETMAVRALAETLLDHPAPLPKVISINVRSSDQRAPSFQIVLRCETVDK